MRVTKSKVNKSEISSLIDLEIPKTLPKRIQKTITNDIGEYIKEQVLLKVSSAQSPVNGESFDSLSKNYKAKKSKDGYSPKANLEVTGDLLDSFDFINENGAIRLGVFGSQAPKADGHNNFSGESKIPQRRFIPKEGQSFDSEIEKGVEAIIADSIAENTKLDLEGIESEKDLFAYLGTVYAGYTRKEIREIVRRNPDLWDELEEFQKWLG